MNSPKKKEKKKKRGYLNAANSLEKKSGVLLTTRFADMLIAECKSQSSVTDIYNALYKFINKSRSNTIYDRFANALVGAIPQNLIREI